MFWKDHKTEILIGIGASIIATIILNSVNLFVKTAPSVGVSFIDTLRNNFYASAASYTDARIPTILCSFLLGIFLGIIFNLMIFVNKAIHKASKVRSKKDSVPVSDSSDNKTRKKEKVDMRELRFLFNLSCFASIILLILAFVYGGLPMDVYQKFNKDITIITPYVEDNEIDLLKSKWVLMENYTDYLEIYNEIDRIKDANQIPKS